MEKERNAFQALEGFRTDEKADGSSNISTTTDERTRFFRKKWFKNIMVSVAFLVMISLSLTVYAFTGGKEKETQTTQGGQWETDKQLQKKQQLVQNEQKKSSPKSDEALHLQYTEKIEQTKSEVQTSTQRRNPPQLQQPPQPKRQEKPASNDQPMQIPEHLKDQIENGNSTPPPEKKKP